MEYKVLIKLHFFKLICNFFWYILHIISSIPFLLYLFWIMYYAHCTECVGGKGKMEIFRFNQVSFGYPEEEDYALKDIWSNGLFGQ